jgi:hypothetical protein
MTIILAPTVLLESIQVGKVVTRAHLAGSTPTASD